MAKSATTAASSEGWAKASEGYKKTSAFTSQFAAPLAAAVTEKLGELSQRQQSISLLDMAAGDGEATFRISNALLRHCQGRGGGTVVHVVATDFSSDMLGTCQRNLFAEDGTEAAQDAKAFLEAGTMTFRTEVADAQDHAAFADGSFDVITCLFGLMFPPDPQKVVRELWRLLRPGGVAAVGVWHYNSVSEDLFSDLAHVFMKQAKGVDVMPSSSRFGREGFLRNLFRSSRRWADEDLDVRVASASLERSAQGLVSELNRNPFMSPFGHWNEEAVLEHMKRQNWVNKTGMYEARGTVLIMTAVKPLTHLSHQ